MNRPAVVIGFAARWVKTLASSVAALIAAALLYIMLTNVSHAHEYTTDSLRIEAPWSRESPPGTSVGVGYMRITNTGDAPDRLFAGRSPVAEDVQFHRSVRQDNGTTKMVRQQDGVAVPAGATVDFAPGGYHVMLMGLKRPLDPDKPLPITLRFERAGRVQMNFAVQPLGASGPPSH